jgi:asparagine synthase (glutamine-hydrolysing)
LIAVSFDPSGRVDDALLADAFAPIEPEIIRAEAFQLAYTPPVQTGAAGTLLCALEGELFNRSELCRALRVSPGTESVELVALAYSAWDLEALARLRGTFAIVVWDPARRRGLLATDHFAVQPWYVWRADGRLIAATSMRTLLRTLPSPPEVDPVKAITWLACRFAPGAETFARGVERLPGAHAIVFEHGGITLRRWWQPVYREPLRASRAELVDQMRSALVQAVRSRTTPGETTGVILSGGFDSSAVTGVAASERETPDQLRTYSAGFPEDPAIDESARVRDLVVARGLPNHLLHVQPVGNVRLIMAYQRDWGIPCAGPGYLLERPLLERAAHDGVRGMLDGQGGDELFGFSPYLIADRVRGGHLRAAMRLLATLPDQAGLPPRSELWSYLREYAVRPLLPSALEHRLRLRGDPARHLPAWLRRDRLEMFLENDDHLAWTQTGEGPLWWRYRAHQLTTLRGGLTEYIGHRGRDLGLRMRPPLLDVDLVELSLQMPPELAYGGINRSLARESVAGDLPDSVRLEVKKSSLRPFYHQTLSGPDLAAIRLLLQRSDARIYEYVDRDWMLEAMQRPTPIGQAGWKFWVLAMWLGLTGEIAIRSLEDAGFCQDFIDAHEPPAGRYTEL